MNVVDIRNIFGSRDVEPIEVTDRFIYYTEKKKNSKNYEIFLFEYNRSTCVEKVITRFKLNCENFSQYIETFEDKFFIVLQADKINLWAFLIDKKTDFESNRVMIKCDDEFLGCKVLDEDNILIYTKRTEDNENDSSINEDRVPAVCKNVSLYDIKAGKKYIVRDSRLVRIEPDKIYTYKLEDNRKYVLICDPYGSKALKEKCFKKSCWLKNEICDYIWYYPLEDLLEDIKAQNYDIALKNIVCAKTESIARYVCMDDEKVYFWAKHFTTEKEGVYYWDKNSKNVNCFFDTDKNINNSYYYVDSTGSQAFEIYKSNNKIHVSGIVGSKINASFEEKYGKFKGCIDNRFIIASKVLENEKDKKQINYTYVIDNNKNTSEEFKCKCLIKNCTLVLY